MNKIVQTLLNGATYEGSVTHSLINYALLLITMLPYLATGDQIISKRVPLWIFLTSVFVQVLLWFCLDATGMSVVWCAIAGLTLLVFLKERSFVRNSTNQLLAGSLIMAFSGIVYYAVTLPPVTTIAHGVAVIMGIGLYYLYRRRANAKIL